MTLSAAQHPELWQPLQRLARRRRRLELARAICYWLALALGGLLTLVIVRWSFPRLPQALAIGLWVAFWLALAGTALLGLRHAWRAQTRAAGASGLHGTITQVEHAAPEIEERFSSAVELLAEPDERFRGSPELVACLVRQAQGAVRKLDVDVVLPLARIRRGALLLLSLTVLWLLLALARPAALAEALGQSLRPWTTGPQATAGADFPWQIKPGSCQIAQADPLIITAEYQPPGLPAAKPAPGREDTVPAPVAPVRGLTLLAHFPNGQTITYPMMRTGTASFQYTFDHVAQDFVYQVRSSPATDAAPAGASPAKPAADNDLAESAPFTVTVLPRPELQQLTVRYEYPLYTRLGGPGGKRTDDHGDGDIEAPVGTRVTIEATTTLPLAPTSHLLLNPDSATPLKLLLTPPAGPTEPRAPAPEPPAARHLAAATLLLDKPGSFTYRPMLFCRVGSSDVPSLPQRTRLLRVQADAPPQVKILAPGSLLRVRPTETVPVHYDATDDFGLVRLQARYQIDQTALEVVELPLGPDQPAHAQGVWAMALPELLARKNLTTARRITYQLKATDNAPASGPPPALPGQDTLTPVYTLELDQNARPLEPELAAKAPGAQELADTVKKLQDQQRQLANSGTGVPPVIPTTGKAPEKPTTGGTPVPPTTGPTPVPPPAPTPATAPSSPSATTAPAPPREDPAARQAREIQELKQKVEQLGRDIAAAKQQQRPPVRPGDPANQQAKDLAQQVERQARTLPKTDAAKKSAAQEALHDAQAAKDAAAAGKAEEAQQRLSSATSKLEQAAPKPAEPGAKPGASAQAKSETPKDAGQPKAAPKNPPNPADPTGAAKSGESGPKGSETNGTEAKQPGQQTAAGQTTAPGQPSSGQSQRQGGAEPTSGTGTPGTPNGASEAAGTATGQTAGGAKPQNTAQSTPAQAQERLTQQMRQAAQQAQQAAQESQQNGDTATAQQLAQAARQMQDAAAAQERAAQAARQGDAAGAAQAQQESAQRLAQGNQTLQQAAQSAQAAPAAPAPQNPHPGQNPGTTSANAAGGGGGHPPAPAANTPPQPLPVPVQELGISPGDWARLTPDLQQQLLNAARQPGPPEYQELIKHYFERIARLESAPPAPPPPPAAPGASPPVTPARGHEGTL